MIYLHSGWDISSSRIPNFPRKSEFQPKILAIFWRACHFILSFSHFFVRGFLILQFFRLLSWGVSWKSFSLTSVRPTSYRKRDCKYTEQLCVLRHHIKEHHWKCSFQAQHDHFLQKMLLGTPVGSENYSFFPRTYFLCSFIQMLILRFRKVLFRIFFVHLGMSVFFFVISRHIALTLFFVVFWSVLEIE